MKYIIPFFLLLLASCQNNETKPAAPAVKKELDTLYITGKTLFPDGNKIFNLELRFMQNGKFVNDSLKLPKNDTLYFSLQTKNAMREILKHADLMVKPESKGIYFETIDDFNYKVFIRPDFEEQYLDLEVFIKPHAGHIIELYFPGKYVWPGDYKSLTIMTRWCGE